MNHYPHHIGDFAASTRHLSRIERDIYRDMRDMYFLKEAPLDGSDPDLMARRLCCTAPDELAALQFVLSEFFEQDADGMWHNAECDEIIRVFQAGQAESKQAKSNEAVRKDRSRKRRAAIFSALRDKGVVPEATATIAQLLDMCRSHGITVPRDGHVPGHVTGQGVTSDGTGTGNQNQNQNQIHPPNPPAGGASGGLAIATALCSHFPKHRRTRLVQVAELVAELVAGGTVTGEQLLLAAQQQQTLLAKDDGRAAPNVLTWLRRQGWLDSAVLGDDGAPPSDWRERRSSVEAMAARVGMRAYEEEPGLRLFDDYRAEVERRLAEQGVAA